MKKSEKISAISGISLLVVAALFLVSLLLQLIPFANRDAAPLLNGLGGLLYGAYGYSSFLIPAFFFAAGLGCFLFPWSEKIGVLYASSCIPFFTIVVCEKVCAGMLSLGNSPLVGIQIAVAIIVCILLLAIEYFGASCLGVYIQNKMRAGVSQPLPPKTTAYPPIFPQGIIQEHLLDAAEDELAVQDESVEEVSFDEAQDEVEAVPFEERELIAEDQFHVEANLLLDGKLPVEDELSVEIQFPEEDDQLADDDFDCDLEETQVIESIYIQDELPQPVFSAMKEEAVETEFGFQQEIPVPAGVAEADQMAPAEGAADNSAVEQEPQMECQEKPMEDVFGEDFFATAPVPEADVFSKEYIEEFQLQKKACHKESVVADNSDDATVQSTQETSQIQEHQIQEDHADEEPTVQKSEVVVQFQPIPKYSLDPTPIPPVTNLNLDSPELENPGEAAFFEDPFGENSGVMDNFIITQAAHLVDKSLEIPESVVETECIVNEEHHLLDDSIVRQSYEENDEFHIPFDEPEDETQDGAEEAAFSEENFQEELEDGDDEEAPLEDDDSLEDEEAPLEDEDVLGDEEISLEDEDVLEDEEIPLEDKDVLEDEAEESEPFVAAAQLQQSVVERAVPHRVRGPYNVPANELLTSYPDGEYWVIDEETVAASHQLKDTLSEFKIEAEVTGIRKGPVITMFEILPAPGVKLSKIVALQDNIALRLAASSVRIVAPIPGKHAVGIEVPNKERAIVSFKELIDTEHPAFRKQAVPVVLGKDITGEAQVIDLAKTPHLLIAGSTGSGKSVCVNSLILSILFKRSPQEVRMILIDPKIVELKLYNDIPHLLTPVITEPKKAFQALQYCLCEMERRYALLDGMGVREITSYNKRIVERNIATEKLPYIVVIIDEFADLMATTGKELESTVARLAAMSRAVGIHLVLATQRPSIDVITGLIKANIPSRIAFMVASKMDSRIIIDQVGAEKLLGKGDMLYASATDPFPVRIQGTFVSDNEEENVVDFVKQYGEPDYIDDEIFVDDEEPEIGSSLFGEGDDPLYDQAVEIVMQAGKASASYIQRRLKIGYNRAARLVEEMEEKGLVGPANGSKPREIIHMP